MLINYVSAKKPAAKKPAARNYDVFDDNDGVDRMDDVSPSASDPNQWPVEVIYSDSAVMTSDNNIDRDDVSNENDDVGDENTNVADDVDPYHGNQS